MGSCEIQIECCMIKLQSSQETTAASQGEAYFTTRGKRHGFKVDEAGISSPKTYTTFQLPTTIKAFLIISMQEKYI